MLKPLCESLWKRSIRYGLNSLSLWGLQDSTSQHFKLSSASGQILKKAWNISEISSGFLYNFSFKLFVVSVQFFASSSKTCLENFTKFPLKYFNERYSENGYVSYSVLVVENAVLTYWRQPEWKVKITSRW